MKKIILLAIAVLFVAPFALGATNHVVNMTGNTYDPDLQVITVGDTVTWTNLDAGNHTATADLGAFDSGDIAPAGSWSFVFDEPGEYAYTCNYHPTMKGTIFVTVYAIPSMTYYGLGILALLLIGTTVWVLRRRRAGAVA